MLKDSTYNLIEPIISWNHPNSKGRDIIITPIRNADMQKCIARWPRKGDCIRICIFTHLRYIESTIGVWDIYSNRSISIIRIIYGFNV